MSLSALVYRSRRTLTIDVETLGALRDERTGEYYFPTPEHDGKFPSHVFIAGEFWVGNVSGVAELREELHIITKREDLLVQEKCLYSGSHSGDVIEMTALPALEREIHYLRGQHRASLSAHAVSFLDGMSKLIETAKKENNPIVFV